MHPSSQIHPKRLGDRSSVDHFLRSGRRTKAFSPALTLLVLTHPLKSPPGLQNQLSNPRIIFQPSYETGQRRARSPKPLGLYKGRIEDELALGIQVTESAPAFCGKGSLIAPHVIRHEHEHHEIGVKFGSDLSVNFQFLGSADYRKGKVQNLH